MEHDNCLKLSLLRRQFNLVNWETLTLYEFEKAVVATVVASYPWGGAVVKDSKSILSLQMLAFFLNFKPIN